MLTISAKEIKKIRERTRAGIMDYKKALIETDGDITRAIEWLDKTLFVAAVTRRETKNKLK